MADQADLGDELAVHPLQERNGCVYKCVVDALITFGRRDVDLLGIILKMHKLKLISKYEQTRLTDKYADIRPNLQEFANEILRIVTFEKFCFVLESVGYSDIILTIRQNMFSMMYKKLPKKEMAHSKRTHDYYRTMKSRIDDRSLGGDVRAILGRFIEKQNRVIMSDDDSLLVKKDFAMEKKAATLVLLIQQYKDNDERKSILQGVYNQEANGIDKTTLEIVYHSKMAMTEAQAGREDEAEMHIAQTKILCENCGPSFAVTAALHDIEYTYKVLYLQNPPSEERLEKVISEGEVALQSLQEEREDVRKLWQRILLLFMVLATLRIDGDFHVGDVSELTKSHRKRAESILTELKRLSGSMELRRTMVMCMCLAALNEGNDNDAAEVYAKKAFSVAQRGGSFRQLETDNIERYLHRVQQRKKWLRISKLNMFLIMMFLFVFVIGIILFAGEHTSDIVEMLV